ncbi:MAG: transporter [Candidatus Viridilinea halotolerans]|uniref:Transporter n=1 Tax=Candidatus Viridilinea halotolerans TaxID=2491704 RepID=A0A426U1U7_9CHLR|nr:MAG: transporter [Candidatus Viridilinea halotolerans]
MIDLLIANPLLLLFVVAAIGYLFGRIKLAGISLGVAAVLFVGLAFGALHPDLRIPQIVYLLGLVLSVYTIGLSSGPSFFASFQRKGLRDNILVLGVIMLAALGAVAAHRLLGLTPAMTAGMFAGSLTNTPALAGVIEQLKNGTGSVSSALLAEPVVGYSVTYPMGVLGMILTAYLLQRFWKVDYAQEARALAAQGGGYEHLVNRTICVTRPEMDGRNLGELMRTFRWRVLFGRLQHNGEVELATSASYLRHNDLLSAVGTEEELARVMAQIGEEAPDHLALDRHTIDFRRVFVSNKEIAGKRLRELDLPRTHGAIITRLRRGDGELLPNGDTVIELGDMVRIVTRRENMDAVSKFFGDSYRRLSEIDVVSLSLGLALGLLLGMVPIPLPGGMSFALGFAGGPLLVALILGWLERTGPIVWSLPYSANLTIRQLGLTLFLAGIGINSGHSFVTTFAQSGGLAIFFAGTLMTCTAALTLLVVAHKFLKIPMGICLGMLAGMQTQAAVLAFANDQTRNDMPTIGYTTVYPMATIGKIVLAQVLLLWLT